MKPATLALLVCLLGPGAAARAEDQPSGGDARIPLALYHRLVQAGEGGRPGQAPRASLGKAAIELTVSEEGGRLTALVAAELSARVMAGEWTAVPLLPLATAVRSLTVDGAPADWIVAPEGLAWGAERAGSFRLRLEYTVEVTRSAGGFALALPLPRAASSELRATLPGSGLDVAVVPATRVSTPDAGGLTRVEASLPPGAAALLTWRAPSAEGAALGRARYQGELRGDAVAWSVSFSADLFSSRATLILFPRTVTLADLQVDGRPAPLLVQGSSLATRIDGKGSHEITARFETRVTRGEGPPATRLDIPEVPVSRFELLLPGRKEVRVEPQASVTHASRPGGTLASVHIPMGSALSFHWTEAVPEETAAPLSANASFLHAFHAEEGVLHARASVTYEITRGETSELSLEVPPGVQLNRIVAPGGGVSDWREAPSRAGEPRRVQVFLDRKVKGEFAFDAYYEVLLGTTAKATERMVLPLLAAGNVHRQRGMAVLLTSEELELRPVEEKGLSRVGENQLPPAFRDSLTLPVKATYKYVEARPSLIAQAQAPERKSGKLDAQVDTLISIGEVSLKGQASIAIHVKSGALMDLELELPAGLNVLALTAPSLRDWTAREEGGRQALALAFTQEVEGDLRLELVYERILGESKEPVEIPVVRVIGAEAEHGRIAVEALAALEVRPAAAERVSSVDLAELPQQLVLRTTNPILLAWKYVRGEPAFRVALAVARHKQIDVQVAAVDEARYQTLFTSDGLAVTTAHLLVRNTRKQFLEIALPAGSEVWSVRVSGRGEKPALAEGHPDQRARVLVPLASSEAPFPVDLVYATKLPRLGSFGKLKAELMRPDVVVTRTRWDAYLPVGPAWGQVSTNMEPAAAGEVVGLEGLADAAREVKSQPQASLRFDVPARGVHFAFEKLYANQGEEEARFAISYAGAGGRRAGVALAGTMGVLLGIGLALLLGFVPTTWRGAGAGALAAGLGLGLLAVTWLAAPVALFMGLAVVTAAGLGARAALGRRVSVRMSETA